jgi:hypothetical protein
MSPGTTHLSPNIQLLASVLKPARLGLLPGGSQRLLRTKATDADAERGAHALPRDLLIMPMMLLHWGKMLALGGAQMIPSNFSTP